MRLSQRSENHADGSSDEQDALSQRMEANGSMFQGHSQGNHHGNSKTTKSKHVSDAQLKDNEASSTVNGQGKKSDKDYLIVADNSSSESADENLLQA